MSELDTGAIDRGREEPRELVQEMRSSFLDYAMSVIVSRALPDVRDGLTREERVVLYVLNETQKGRGDRNEPTAMLWGRVCEHFYISPEDLSLMLARMGVRK